MKTESCYLTIIIITLFCTGCFSDSDNENKKKKLEKDLLEIKKDKSIKYQNIDNLTADKAIERADNYVKKIGENLDDKSNFALQTLINEQKKILLIMKKCTESANLLNNDEFLDFSLMKKNNTMSKWISILIKNNLEINSLIVGWQNLYKNVEEKLIDSSIKESVRTAFLKGLKPKLNPKVKSIVNVEEHRVKLNKSRINLINFYSLNIDKISVNTEDEFIFNNDDLISEYNKLIQNIDKADTKYTKLYDAHIALIRSGLK